MLFVGAVCLLGVRARTAVRFRAHVARMDEGLTPRVM